MYTCVYSWFSYKYGIHAPEKLLEAAAALGIRQLALADINNTAGNLDFLRCAATYGIQAVAGVSFWDAHGLKYVLLAKNNQGYHFICALLTAHLRDGAPLPDLVAPSEDYWIIYPLARVPDQLVVSPETPQVCIGVSSTDLSLFRFSKWTSHLRQVVMLQPTFFLDPSDASVHRILRAIHGNTFISQVPRKDPGLHLLKEEAALCHDFHEFPTLLFNTREMLASCHVDLGFGVPKNRKLFGSSAQEDFRLLYQTAYDGLHQRYIQTDTTLIARLEKELASIHALGFTTYFLINHDIVRYARHRDFFHVGRGSGANSLVAYCLGITDVDPMDLDLYFERFINPHRENPPDFDLDFSWRDRDEVQRYLFRRYGREHVGLLGAYQTFQYKSALREIGKSVGLQPGEIDALQAGKVQDTMGERIVHYAARLKDMPSHLSIHAGGVLISDQPLTQYMALEMPPKAMAVTQCSMLEAEDLGLYKFDILSQRGLGHIRDTLTWIRTHTKASEDLSDVARLKQDPKVQAHLQSGETMGCFYIESPAMRMLLKKLEARTYLDVVAASSIIRPGVARSGMMRAFIERFRHPERITYIHPRMEELLKETFGIMVYQEDVIKVAHHFAGLDLAEADILRRGMSGKFRSKAELERVKTRFFEQCNARGYAPDITQTVWHQIESFAGYSFSKAHSASYAVESFQSAYLKAYYPLPFMVSVINNEGGFYRTEVYLYEAARLGAVLEAPCIQHSLEACTLHGRHVYVGFGRIKGLKAQTIQAILQARAEGHFESFEDFLMRVAISLEQLKLLIYLQAFRTLTSDWKALLWEAQMHAGSAGTTTASHGVLFAQEASLATLPTLDVLEGEVVQHQFSLLGFTLCHPFTLLPPEPHPRTYVLARDWIRHLGQVIWILGYWVTTKETRTLRGDVMQFGTFMDREGDSMDTVHFPAIREKYPFKGIGMYRLKGKVVEDFGCCILEVHHMERIPWKCN